MDMGKTETISEVKTKLPSGRFVEITVKKTIENGATTWTTVGKIIGLRVEVHVINSCKSSEIMTRDDLKIALERTKEIMETLKDQEKKTTEFLEWEHYLREKYSK